MDLSVLFHLPWLCHAFYHAAFLLYIIMLLILSFASSVVPSNNLLFPLKLRVRGEIVYLVSFEDVQYTKFFSKMKQTLKVF